MSIDTSKINFDIDAFLDGREPCPEADRVRKELEKNGYKMVQEFKKQQAEDWYKLANLTVGVNG